MRRYHNYNTREILVLPDDLQAFAWSAPIRDLAAKLDLSNAALKKCLAIHGIALPPLGYWTRARGGRPLPKCPEAPTRRPGGIGRFKVDGRFSTVLLPVPSLSSEGPFASALVPEDLDHLYAQELKAIGRAGVPSTLDAPHRGLLRLLEKEKGRQEKAAEQSWDGPKFDTPLGKRRLRILNGIFLALSKRGHDGHAGEYEEDIHASAMIGDTYIPLEVRVAGAHRTVKRYGHLLPAPDLPASTPLLLRLNPDIGAESSKAWQDDSDGKLEAKISLIAAALIVAGEAKFRRTLREEEDQAKRERLRQEKRRQEQLAELNRRRVENLLTSGALLRQALDIRALVQRMRQAIVDGSAEIEPSVLEAWEEWALAEADRVDPVRSGQFMTHLHEPAAQ